MSVSPVITTIIGQRNCLHLVVNGYTFFRSGGSKTLYRCKYSDCQIKVRVTLNENNQFQFVEFINGLSEHMHEKDNYDQMSVTNALLDSYAKNPSLRFEPTSKILEKIDTINDPRRESTLRREFNYLRKKELGELIMENHPEHEKYLVHSNSMFSVFCNKEKLTKLKSSSHILMDGTFKTSPPDFIQVYTVHPYSLNEHFTLFHCLLKNKCYETYKDLFSVLQNYCLTYGFRLFNDTCTYMIDFENAVIKALTDYKVKIKGCFFHFSQCIFRKIQTNGMTIRYRTDMSFHSWVKRLMMLPLLEEDAIKTVFEEMYKEIQSTDDSDLLVVFNYFKRNWINGCYGISMWCCGMDVRTNNITESFHSVLSKRIKSHPSSFEYLEKTIKREKLEDKKLKKLIEGHETRRRKMYQRKDAEIEICKRNRQRGLINSDVELLDALGRCVGKLGYENLYDELEKSEEEENNVNEEEAESYEIQVQDCQEPKRTEETKPRKEKKKRRRSCLSGRQRVLLGRGILYDNKETK